MKRLGGGYTLRWPAEKIPVGEVLRALDGPVAPLPCAATTGNDVPCSCPDPRTCPIRSFMTQLHVEMNALLDARTIEDLAKMDVGHALAFEIKAGRWTSQESLIQCKGMRASQSKRALRHVARYLCLINLSFGGILVRAEVPLDPSTVPAPEVSFAPVQAKLESSRGSLTPEVRAAWLDWAEQTVLRKLGDTGQSVPADCLAEVRGDATVRDAVFGAVDPPDPSILQNYARLRSELGAPFMAKYRALVIADAVVTRTNGAREQPDPELRGEAPTPPAGGAPQNAPDPLVAGIAGYMKQSGVTALELFHNQQEQQKLAGFLKAEKVDASLIAKIGDESNFQGLLKKALIALGQRPAYRDPPPDAAAWLRYLASVYEATPISSPTTKSGQPFSWPLFPIDRAPWPLLMPLHHAYPLREAVYIWEKYQGLHGPDRYHTYGPFKKQRDGEWDLELQPSPWHWDAWPDLIVHGGVCTTIAPMSVETHVTLCQPAMMAGQPGHSNLMSYRNAGGFWYTVVEQAYAGGPDVTGGSWLFNEIGNAPGLGEQNHRAWASSEYHIGLADAMDIGLRQYMDTRIAVNLYHHLPRSELMTLGNTLLSEATHTNPFNPAPWYFLGKQTSSSDEGIILVKLAMEDAHSAGAEETGNGGGPSALVTFPKPVESAMHVYWQVIEEKMTKETVLKHHVPEDTAAAESICDFLKTVPGISEAQEMPYLLALKGPIAEETRLKNIVQQHLAGAKEVDRKSARQRFAAELKAFLAAASKEDGDALLAQLKTTLLAMPANDPYLLIVDAAKPRSK